MWTTDVCQVTVNPLFELELVLHTEISLQYLSQAQTDAIVPLCFFNVATPVDVGWNFSVSSGLLPPFSANTIVTQPDVEVMMLVVGVYSDCHHNHMTMVCVLNVYNVNRDGDPMNVSKRGTFSLFP